MEDDKFIFKLKIYNWQAILFDSFYVHLLKAFNLFSYMFSYLFYCVPFQYIGQVIILAKSQIGPVNTIIEFS